MSAGQPNHSPESAKGLHVATIAHEGQLWDVYLDFVDQPNDPVHYRGRIRFNQAGGDAKGTPTQTTVIIIEESYESAIAKARTFDERQLQAMLRSTLPDGA